MAARPTHLSYEAEIALRKDMHLAQRHVDELLLGVKPNRVVVTPHYLSPRVDDHQTLPKTDEKGELHHYRTVRNILEYIFEHEGQIREKYRERLTAIHAPPYVTALITLP